MLLKFIILSIFVEATAGASGTKILSLVVTGSIAPAPEWRNAAGFEISSINLSFAGQVAGTTDDRPIQSEATSARLINAINYPSNVNLRRPSGCHIGATNIDDQHVEFVFNNSLAFADGVMSLTSDRMQSFMLQFSKAGHYGKAFGPVHCDQGGALIYGY